MQFLIISALVAAAFASPVLVFPENAGPAPIINDDYTPVNPGPAFIEEYETINVGPAIIEGKEDIAVGPAIIDEAVNQAAVPVVQIIVNINSASHVIEVPLPEVPVPEVPGLPEVVAPLPTPVVVPEYVPSPVQIGTPELPAPVIVLPESLN